VSRDERGARCPVVVVHLAERSTGPRAALGAPVPIGPVASPALPAYAALATCADRGAVRDVDRLQHL